MSFSAVGLGTSRTPRWRKVPVSSKTAAPSSWAEDVVERSEVGRAQDAELGWGAVAPLDRGQQAAVGGDDERRSDPASGHIVDGEAEQLAEDVMVERPQHAGTEVEPPLDGRLQLPVDAVVAEHAEGPDGPNYGSRMALDHGGARGLGQDRQIALGADAAIEDHKVVHTGRAANDPAHDAIGEASDGRVRELGHLAPADIESDCLGPTAEPRRWLDERPVARHPSLVDRRSQGVGQLLEQRLPTGGRHEDGRLELVQLLPQPAHVPWRRRLPSRPDHPSLRASRPFALHGLSSRRAGSDVRSRPHDRCDRKSAANRAPGGSGSALRVLDGGWCCHQARTRASAPSSVFCLPL